MAQATAEITSPPAVRAAARKNLPPDTIKKSLRTCAVHGYLSNPDASEESQQHGYDVHLWRVHNKRSKKKAKKNKVVKNSSTKTGALQVITEDGVKTVRTRTKPPKAFFDLKESWVREAANSSGAEQDAYLACATDLGRLLKSFK